MYECETGETYTDLAELLKGKDYYIVTTNQDAQFYRVFPENRITRLQGDWRYFQCKECCHDAIYYNKGMVMELNDKIVNDCLPKHTFPIVLSVAGRWMYGSGLVSSCKAVFTRRNCNDI